MLDQKVPLPGEPALNEGGKGHGRQPKESENGLPGGSVKAIGF